MNTKRKYDRAPKERALKLSYERSLITELASELGILPDRIHSWCKEFSDYGSASFSGHGIERLNDEGRKVKELEKKLKTTELELEILRKKTIAVSHKLCRHSAISRKLDCIRF